MIFSDDNGCKNFTACEETGPHKTSSDLFVKPGDGGLLLYFSGGADFDLALGVRPQ